MFHDFISRIREWRRGGDEGVSLVKGKSCIFELWQEKEMESLSLAKGELLECFMTSSLELGSGGGGGDEGVSLVKGKSCIFELWQEKEMELFVSQSVSWYL